MTSQKARQERSKLVSLASAIDFSSLVYTIWHSLKLEVILSSGEENSTSKNRWSVPLLYEFSGVRIDQVAGVLVEPL